MKKSIRKNLSLLTGLSIAAGSFAGLYFLGKSYVKNSQFDFVLQINKKTTINYSRAAGDVAGAALNFQEGLFRNSISDQPSKKLINNPSVWGNEQTRNRYKKLTEDANIYRHNDFSVINPDNPSNGATEVIANTGQSYGLAKAAVVNKNSTKWRFYIRKNQKWSTGETVKPSDFAFANFKILNQRNASAAEYLASKYGMIKGASKWHYHQLGIITEGLIESQKDWDQFYTMFWDEEAGTSGINLVTGQVNKGKKEDAGIVFNNTEGYIQYQMESSNDPFRTILQNPLFLPVNQEWFENDYAPSMGGGNKIGYDSAFFKMGYNEDTLSTYGAYNVTRFDSPYGLEFEKNDNYWDAKTIINDKMQFRVITEQSTQLAMFNSGKINAFHPDEVGDKTLLTRNENSSKYIDWQLGNPTARYANFNLDSNNHGREAAKYYKNPNFRRSLYYAMNRGDFLKFSNSERAVPSSMITETNFGSYNTTTGSDTLVNLGYNTKLYEGLVKDKTLPETSYLNGYTEDVRKKIILTPQEKMDGVEYERGVTEVTNHGDAKTSKTLAVHFWNKFKEDMASSNISVPETIILEFMTDQGDSDSIANMLRSSLEAIPEIGVDISIVPVPKGQTIPTWINGNFDLINIAWNVDIGDAWGGLSIFNSVNRAKSFNLSSAWNYWSGSEETYGDTYSSKPSWSSEGFKDLRDDGTIYKIVPDTITTPDATLTGIHSFIKDDINLYDPSLGEKPTSAAVNVEYNTAPVSAEGENFTYRQINGTTQTNAFGLTSEQRAKLYIIFEALFQHGAPVLLLGNALPAGVPTVSPFSSVPVLGYLNQYWVYNPSNKKAKELGMPSIDAILDARG